MIKTENDLWMDILKSYDVYSFFVVLPCITVNCVKDIKYALESSGHKCSRSLL